MRAQTAVAFRACSPGRHIPWRGDARGPVHIPRRAGSVKSSSRVVGRYTASGIPGTPLTPMPLSEVGSKQGTSCCRYLERLLAEVRRLRSVGDEHPHSAFEQGDHVGQRCGSWGNIGRGAGDPMGSDATYAAWRLLAACTATIAEFALSRGLRRRSGDPLPPLAQGAGPRGRPGYTGNMTGPVRTPLVRARFGIRVQSPSSPHSMHSS